MDMKKILYITTVSSTINAFLIPHIEMLIKQGNQVDCACYINKPIDNKLLEKGCKIFEVPFVRNPLHPANIKAFKKLVKIQKENNYDIVHVHTPVASVYGRLLKIKFPDLKTIYTAHGFHFYKGAPKIKYFLFYNIEKFMSRLTDILITMNNEDYKVASSKFYAKNVFKINGVGIDIDSYTCDKEIDKVKFKEDLGLKKDDFVITVVAELCNRKNHKQIIYAIREIVKEYDDIKVLFVGEGPLREKIKKCIDNNDLSEYIKLLGYRSDISKILNITDIVGLFSYHEGLPRNLMEAMAARKPIICTDIRGNRDLVQNNINGLLVPIDDINETIYAIKKLYNNKYIMDNMSKEGFDYINKFSEENILLEILSIY